MNGRTSGTVKWFDARKGYGFINAAANPSVDYFVHHTCILMKGFRTLDTGQPVTFIPVHALHRGWQATEVVPS